MTHQYPEERYEGTFFKTIPSFPLRNGLTTIGMGDFSLDHKGSEDRLKRLMELAQMRSSHRLIPKHAGKFSVADEDARQIVYHTGDAIISRADKEPKLLTSPTGDCPIILLTNQEEEFGAIIHAGWRPIKEQIVKNTVAPIKDIFPSEKMMAGIFPGICEKCFEVTPGFGEGYFDSQIVDCRLNLKQVIVKELAEAGISENNILSYKYCSYHNEQYYSHRKGNPERNLVFMVT